MNPSMTFNLAGGPGVRVTVVQMPDGTLQITASLISTAVAGDLRGLFFQVSNESLLGGLSVTASTSSVTGFQQNANAVSNLGSGVNTLGAARASDVGIAFGTASTSGADDIRSVTFTLAHATESLTLDFLSQMQFAAVIGSVGPAGGPRSATLRAVGSAPANAPPLAQNDAATVTEGGSVTIDVLANDSDPTNDALAITGFTQPAKGSVTLVDGKLVFDASAGFESLGDGESEIQTFTYTVSDDRGGSTTATVAVTVTGVAPPAPTVAFATPAADQTPENGGALVFTLTRTGDLSAASTVDLRLSGTADETDLVGITGAVQLADPSLWRVSFAPGQASATVEVLVAPDSTPEADETVSFTIEGASGAVLSSTGPLVATGLILNDDIPPALAFRSLDAGGSAEGTAGFAPPGRLAFALERSGDLSFATRVVFELGGSATPDDIASVTAANGGSVTPFPFVEGRYILTFDSGAASADIELFLAADTEIEADETVTLTLVSATAGTLPPEEQRSATATILDDDAVSVGFAEADAGAVDEGGTGPDGRLAFTLARSGSLALDTVVRFVVQGDVAADEISLLGATRIGAGPPGSLGVYEATIAAGATEQVIEVFALGDRIPEADETVTLDLVEVVANGSLAGITSASGVFLNDDVLPAVAFRTLDAGTSREGTSGTTPQGVLFFVVERSGDLSYPTAVALELGGSASPADIAFVTATNGGSLTPVPGEPGRYTLAFDAGAARADIEVYATPDAEEEAPETITLTLLSASDGRLPDLADRTATGTILDDDASPPPPALALREADAGGAPEGTSGVAPPGRLVFVVTRTGDLSAPTTVTFDLGGTASAGDYTVSSVTAGGRVAAVPFLPGRYVLSFDAGAAEAEIELLMVPDAAIEPDETVTLTLVSATAGTLPPAGARTATGTILDDDAPPPNAPPVANPDAFAVHWRNVLSVATPGLLANDSDPNGDPVQAALFDPVSAAGGAVTMVTDGRFTYAPPAGFVGVDSFTYVISDGVLFSAPATVTVTVTNTAPVATGDAYTGQVGQTLVVGAANGLLLNDLDPDGDPILAVLFDPVSVAGGTVTLVTDGSFTYTPPVGFSGMDSFTYVISDGVANSAAATVTITVLEGTPGPALFRITQTGELARPEGNPLTPIGFVFEVTRAGGDLPAATLTYALGPGPGTSAASADLVAGFGNFTIAFAAGQTSSGIISIPVTADLVPEPDETFTLRLVSATAGTVDPTPIVFTILDDDAAPPPSAPLFYFSGESPGAGRELWLYDARQPPSARVATMVEAAEWVSGPASSDPREISALFGTVFFRADEAGAPMWLAWDGASLAPLAGVGMDAFDAALPLGERNLGLVSGERFWLATPGDFLVPFDTDLQALAAVPLAGSDRRLLTDAGGSPAYAGVLVGWSVESGTFELAEQLFVLHDVPGAGWQTLDTLIVDSRNAIREIAGLQPVADPLAGGQARTVFFTGDYRSVWTSGTFHADALWRVDLRFDWMAATRYAPRLVDLNGTDGAVPLAPRALTVAPVSDGAGGEGETLFLFGRDATGEERLFAHRFDAITMAGQVTSTDLAGGPMQGLEIAPWADGVLFSAVGTDGMGGLEAVVATWTDTDGDGAFDFSILFTVPGGIIEHLAVDGAGNAAWVVDDGSSDTLYTYVGGTVTLVASRPGEIDEVRMAGGHLVFRAGIFTSLGASTLFDHDYAAVNPVTSEIPTDEDMGGAAGIDGFVSGYRSLAINGALVFEALTAPGGPARLFVTANGGLSNAGGGFEAISPGARLGDLWVGSGVRVATGEVGLHGIDATGNLFLLYRTLGGSREVEVIDDRILFEEPTATGFRISIYDVATNSRFTLLNDHNLGVAETVGSRLVFTAFDRTIPANTNATAADDVWGLWTYSAAEGPRLLTTLPTGNVSPLVVEEWRPDIDFLGDDGRLFWRQASSAHGLEVFTLDLAAPSPRPTVIDVAPGPASGADGEAALFAAGRLYWLAESAPGQRRLWTTTDGTDAVPVTGPDLFGGASTLDTGFQSPANPVAMGQEIFFLARVAGTDSWGVFQVNDDGTTASLITPYGFGSAYNLVAVGSDLFFFSRGLSEIADQMWRMTPAATPTPAMPERLTLLDPSGSLMGDIIGGGDGTIYFGRAEPSLGRELGRLVGWTAEGAVPVFDFSPVPGGTGYAPEQVTPVPSVPEDLFG